jgi:hypothetical protein
MAPLPGSRLIRYNGALPAPTDAKIRESNLYRHLCFASSLIGRSFHAQDGVASCFEGPVCFREPRTAVGSLRRRGTVFKGGPGRVYTSVAVICTDVLSRAGVSEPVLISLRNATRITPSDGQGGNNLFGGVKCPRVVNAYRPLGSRLGLSHGTQQLYMNDYVVDV